MNTGNLIVNQWLVMKYPGIVDSYEQFDGENPFRPIFLSGALDTDDTENFESCELTVVVTYNNRYAKFYLTPLKVILGLHFSVDVNEIICLPSLTDWKMTLDFDESKAHYKAMQISFPLFLTEASTGLQQSINFVPTNFFWPKQQTSICKIIHYYSRTYWDWY